MTPTDELTATVCGALGTLSSARKADLLLETSLSLLEAGRYGEEVESYLEVYLRTPDLPKANVVKALSARANARKAAGERLLARAQQGELSHSVARSRSKQIICGSFV